MPSMKAVGAILNGPLGNMTFPKLCGSEARVEDITGDECKRTLSILC
jgi:hypothetical protein